ncbi:MAG: NAD-dependent epimerase/dehydratase family protein [Pseudomonadota bacterium]
MKYVVTGAAGFIGSHLAERLLAEGHEVIGIDNFADYYEERLKRRNLARCLDTAGFTLIEADLLTLDLPRVLEGAEAVFHQAAQAGVRASWGENFRIYTDFNILGTQRLLEAARATRLPKFVYASSSSVYGDASQLPAREDATPRPVSPYGVSKLAGEHLCCLYNRNFGVDAVSLRYFTVYGERQRPDMAFNRFLRWGAQGKPIQLYGDGEQSRDFTYVGDIVEANVLALKGRPGAVYNIGGGSRVTMNESIAIMERLVGRAFNVERLAVQDGDVRHTAADITRAEKDLGYRPKVNLHEGLARELAWLREEGLLGASRAGQTPPSGAPEVRFG